MGDKKGNAMHMSVSGIINKDGKKSISVLFTEGERSAEGTIPDCRIHTNKGFSEEETAALEEYLVREQDSIKRMAKDVNVMNAFMK